MKANPKFTKYQHPNQKMAEKVRNRFVRQANEIIFQREKIISKINLGNFQYRTDFSRGWRFGATTINNMHVDSCPLALTSRGIAVYYGDMSPSGQEAVLFEDDDLVKIKNQAAGRLPGYLQNARLRAFAALR